MFLEENHRLNLSLVFVKTLYFRLISLAMTVHDRMAGPAIFQLLDIIESSPTAPLDHLYSDMIKIFYRKKIEKMLCALEFKINVMQYQVA